MGVSNRGTLAFREVPVRWTGDANPESLGVLPGYANLDSSAESVSHSRDVIVGKNGFVPGIAYQWTETDGLQDLGTLPDYDGSWAIRVNGDGTTIVGSAYAIGDDPRDIRQIQPFLWTKQGGMVGLGTLPGATISTTRDVSADGLVVVGQTGGKGGGTYPSVIEPERVWRWSTETGMLDLGIQPGAFGSMPVGVTSDGSAIIGVSVLRMNSHASHDRRNFVWDESHGDVAHLTDVLVQEHGVNLQGLGNSTLKVGEISDNGKTIVGQTSDVESGPCGCTGFAILLDRPIDASLRR